MKILDFVTEPISVSVSAGVPVTVKHSLGRPVTGWVIVWETAPCVMSVVDPTEDTRQSITLMPNGTASLRLAFLE